MDFLKGFLLQLLSFAGVIFLFGYIISLLRRAFCRIARKSGAGLLLITGIVGTPIHELSHALACLVFGHKIREIKLYQPNSNDGTLGYVKHTYSKRNIYHQIGNFFIGIAPVLLGGGTILLLLLLLLPDAFDAVAYEIGYARSSDVQMSEFFGCIWGTVRAIFSSDSFSSWQGWVFTVLALMIASHTEMSRSDIKSGLKGLLFLTVLLCLADLFLYFVIPDAFFAFTGALKSFALFLSAILSVSVIFLILLVLIALIFKAIGILFVR